MTPQHCQLGEGLEDLLGHAHVGQEHELLDQPVAVTVLVERVALRKDAERDHFPGLLRGGQLKNVFYTLGCLVSSSREKQSLGLSSLRAPLSTRLARSLRATLWSMLTFAEMTSAVQGASMGGSSSVFHSWIKEMKE